MKIRIDRILTVILFICGGLTLVGAQSLPPLTVPKLDYTPSVKKGWVGQYVYQIEFDGKQTLKPTKFEHSYELKIRRIHSGFVELTSEIRGAIRTNQSDRNNGTRWESWIPIGKKETSWSLVDEFIRTTYSSFPSLASAAADKYPVLRQIEKNIRYSSNGTWVRGRTHYVDLQIDHLEGKFSLAVPKVEYTLDGEQWGTKFLSGSSEPTTYRETLKSNLDNDHQGSHILLPIDWDIVNGTYSEGQKEIVIRRRIPVKFEPGPFEERNKKFQLPATTGFMDFYLLLKKVE